MKVGMIKVWGLGFKVWAVAFPGADGVWDWFGLEFRVRIKVKGQHSHLM